MKVAIFLTTRVGSNRLPNKAMIEINRETMTDILIKRLKKTKIPIIMCCPNTLKDILYLKPIADRNKVGIFFGEEQNIIKRQSDCAKEHDIEWIIEADGDDILLCPEVINAVNFAITRNEHKIPIKTEGLPLGLNVIAYPADILDKIDYDCDTNWGAQIIGGKYYAVKFNYDHNYRVTLDYEDDLKVIADILTNCKRNMTVGGICSYLNKHPEVAELNLWRNDEYWKRIKEARNDT